MAGKAINKVNAMIGATFLNMRASCVNMQPHADELGVGRMANKEARGQAAACG